MKVTKVKKVQSITLVKLEGVKYHVLVHSAILTEINVQTTRCNTSLYLTKISMLFQLEVQVASVWGKVSFFTVMF